MVRHVRMPLASDPRGFDLSDLEQYGLVRRIYFSQFRGLARNAGLAHEDVLQAIYLGLLTRDRGRSRWDPTRGALSTWIYVAVKGIVLNEVEKHLGAIRRGGDLGEHQDVALEACRHAALPT